MKIIWAIDALSDGEQLLTLQAKQLKGWIAKADAVIEPVYVMSAGHLHYPQAYFERHRAAIEATLSDRLQEKVQAASGPATLKPRILAADRPGLGAAALTLYNYARTSNADLLALASHSRGLKRFAVGSFCELLLTLSEVPLLIVSPAMTVGTSIETVLFPTDLLPQSDTSFHKVLALTLQHEAALVLLHVSDYLAQHTDGTYGPAEAYFEAVQTDKVKRLQKLQELKGLAENYGVATQVRYIDDEIDPSGAIDAVAKSLPGVLIAMVSHKDIDDFPGFSSVTRSVLRKAERPLWTYHRSLS